MTMIRSASTIVESRCAMQKRGAAAQQVGQSGLDQGLAGGVERAGGFVEHHQGRVFAQRPGDGQPLTFALGELVTPFAHQGVITLGQGQGEVVHQRGAGGGLDLGRLALGAP